MAWGIPEYKIEEYNIAGKILRGDIRREMTSDDAFQIINNWRSSHYHPLNTFQLRVRRKAQEIDSNCLVAQRIKRLASIKHKLERFPEMKLTQIQDIGGCRAIVSTIDDLNKLADIFLSKDPKRSSRGIKHKLVSQKNYVLKPKESGYRGIHLIFRYFSDKVKVYDGLKIEIQLRTYLQHSWATAVETVGTFTNQALKSSMGQPEWLRFFTLASTSMAMIENSPLVPGVDLAPDEVIKELKALYKSLNVEKTLSAYSGAMNIIETQITGNSKFYLLELDIDSQSVRLATFKQNEFEKASAMYLEWERRISENSSANAVLVSADSMTALKKAYPNYFVDTDSFLKSLNAIIETR